MYLFFWLYKNVPCWSDTLNILVSFFFTTHDLLLAAIQLNVVRNLNHVYVKPFLMFLVLPKNNLKKIRVSKKS